MTKNLRIAMVGTGYVGLVSAACFSEWGHSVICVDRDTQKIALLTAGQIPLYEPSLEELVKQNFSKNRLHFTTSLEQGISASEVIFVAVGTPTDPKNGRTDLRDLEALAVELAPFLKEHDPKIIVLKSTVPVGTGEKFSKIIRNLNPKASFEMVSNPEFLREGSAVFDFFNPDRLIVGTETERGLSWMKSVYAPLFENNIPCVATDIKTSEMIKYTANCFLATKLGFINEIAGLCEKLETNIEDLIYGIGLDKRIGEGYLRPGPGFGGSCFPKDTQAFTKTAEDAGYPLSIIESVVHSNVRRKNQMVEKIIDAYAGNVKGKRLAILGLTFKANTDDIRDSASLTIIHGLLKEAAKLSVYDPSQTKKAEKMFPEVEWASSAEEALLSADGIVICTEWDEFKKLDFKKIKSQLKPNIEPPLLIDLRDLYDPKTVTLQGFRYVSLGRPTEEPMAMGEGALSSTEVLRGIQKKKVPAEETHV